MKTKQEAWEIEFDIEDFKYVYTQENGTPGYEIDEDKIKDFIQHQRKLAQEEILEKIFREIDEPSFKPKPGTNNFAIRNAIFSRFMQILDSLNHQEPERGKDMWNNFVMICLTCKEKGTVSVAMDLKKKKLIVSCNNCKKREEHQLEGVN